jgi:diadenosine tetraphosphate (Ap4A) HIT family hydrolase
MSDTQDPYPQTCPFCTIASAYPFPPPSATLKAPTRSGDDEEFLLTAVPDAPDVTKVQPSCFLVLSAPEVMAFLDILPMTRGHLLVVVREHRGKVADLEAGEGRDVGKFIFSSFLFLVQFLHGSGRTKNWLTRVIRFLVAGFGEGGCEGDGNE